MVQPIIHIGYNKTGSTWLQDEVFPKRELGYLSFLDIEDRTAIYRSIVKQHALHFDGTPILEYYRSKVEDSKNQGLVPVFSAERFSGDPHSAGYDTKEIAWRLKELFPGGKVIMVIREQRSMLLSTYKQYVRAGGPRSMKHYFHPPERGSRRMPMFSFEYFEYDPLIRYYQELFGKENLLVLPFEWLRKDPQKFIKEILTFSGLAASDEVLEQLPFKKKVNRGYGPITLRLKRPLNRFFIDNTLNPGALFSMPYGAERQIVELLKRFDSLLPKVITDRSQKKMKSRIRKEVGERYRASNRSVEKLTGLDLETLGYDV